MWSLPQVGKMSVETCKLFGQLFTDITQFNDHRYHKAEMGGSGPEFTHKESGEGLW